MRIFIVCLMIVNSLLFSASISAEEQRPGEPLYFPKGEYKGHESDLAPHTDPHWKKFQQQQQQRMQQGKPIEDPYSDPQETIYESTTRYEIVDDQKEKAKKPPSRWGQ